MCKKFLLAVMTIAFMLTPADAGPFGTNMGDPKEKFQGLEELGADLYSTSTVPENHPLFETYFLIISPKYGLVKIVASSKTFENDAYGTEVRSKFDLLHSQLKSKYGKESFKADFLKEGSIWKEK